MRFKDFVGSIHPLPHTGKERPKVVINGIVIGAEYHWSIDPHWRVVPTRVEATIYNDDETLTVFGRYFNVRTGLDIPEGAFGFHDLSLEPFAR